MKNYTEKEFQKMSQLDTLVIVAHPDDEVLMAGGLLTLEKLNGKSIGVVTLAGNAEARAEGTQHIAQNQLRVFKVLDVDYYRTYQFPDSCLSQVPHLELVEAIESVIELTRPVRIITHFPGDNHSDHKCVSQACQEAMRLLQRPKGNFPCTEMWFGEVPSSTDWGLGEQFHPNVWVPLRQGILDRKIELIAEYDKVFRPAPHPRSPNGIVGLAQIRGGQAGCFFAESFQQVFRIEVL